MVRDKIYLINVIKKAYFPYYDYRYNVSLYFFWIDEIFDTIVSYRYDITSLEMYFSNNCRRFLLISSNYDFFPRNIWKVIGSKEEDWNSRVDFNEVPQRGTGDRRWRRFNRSSFNCEVDLRSTKLLCSPKRICHTWKQCQRNNSFCCLLFASLKLLKYRWKIIIQT